MKRFMIVLFSFLLVIMGCTSVRVSENPADTYGDLTTVPSFQFNNYLPYGIRYAVNGETFVNLSARQTNLMQVPTILSVRIAGDQLVAQVDLDISEADTNGICYGDTLSLAVAQCYMSCLHEWLSISSSSWDTNTAASIAKYRRLYVVEFCHGGARLQVQGKYIKGGYGIEHFEAQTPAYLFVPGHDKMQLRPIKKNASGDYYLSLGPTYDPIRRTYYPAYFVYSFFGRVDALSGTPAPAPWSRIEY